MRIIQPRPTVIGIDGSRSVRREPVATITTSAAIRPLSVSTPSTRPERRTILPTFSPALTWAPASRAASAKARVALAGSIIQTSWTKKPPARSGLSCGYSRRSS